jgi:hypothetical protein
MRAGAAFALTLICFACRDAPRCAHGVDALVGAFARQKPDGTLDHKSRIRFERGGLATFRVASADPRRLVGAPEEGAFRYEEPGGAMLGWVELDAACAVWASTGRRLDGRDVRDAMPKQPFVRAPSLDRADWEPCGGPVQVEGVAVRAGVPLGGLVVGGRAGLRLVAPLADLPEGCVGTIDLRVNGATIDALAASVTPTDAGLAWYGEFQIRHAGAHDLALHRYRTCAGITERIGVGCASIEVK